MTILSAAQVDRACGVLLGAACGDALGAGYELGSAPPPADGPVAMVGGGLGGFAPGEWTDDTAQTWAVADVAATGADLRDESALDEVAQRLASWFAAGPPDVGVQTAAVLRAAGPEPSAVDLRASAKAVHERFGRSGGNGSLMRTSAVALAHLDDPQGVVDAAFAVSALTHHDPRAGEACALWSLAIRHAVLRGELDVRAGLEHLPSGREFWTERIEEAESRQPSDFTPNGYVVTALQAAWAAIASTAGAARRFPCGHVVDALEAAVRIGDDTDTVASIAGALLGASWGASAFPSAWRMQVHGWPGRTAGQLVDLALKTVRGGRPDPSGWPGTARLDYSAYPGHDSLARHPFDDGVQLAGATALDAVPPDVTAVVTLCRVGAAQVPAGLTSVDFRLIDTSEADNPNLDFVIDDAARTVARLRDAGHVVLLHCVAAHSRTPTVAARYAALRGTPADEALAEICRALPAASPNPVLVAALHRLAEGTQ